MAASPAMTMLRSMVAASAVHDGKRGEEDYTNVCHPGTREEYLENLRAWAETAPEEMRVQWANAIAGAGKTAMLRTLCTLLEEQSGFSPISFFIWKNDLLRNTLDRFPATIAAQLCRRIPALVPYVEKAINEDSFLLQSAFKKQMDKLVISPLLDACDAVKGELQHLILVIDGLDELNAQGQTEFLNFIPYFISRLSSLPISLLVSSRPEDMIVGAFEHPKLASITRATRIGASDEDIWKFLNDKFDDINLRFPYLRIKYRGRWPSDEQRAIMVRQSSGLFIWPTVALGHIDKVEKGLRHNERLEQVLSSADPKPWIASALDNLYRTILEANAPEDRESLSFLRFRQRLAYLCLPVGFGTFVWKWKGQVFDWSDTPVCGVFDETLDELWDAVAGLSSLFSPRTTPSEGESPIPGISHRSLRDFTFNRARCGDQLYYSSEQELHVEVVCKFLNFFNTRRAYQDCAEMSANFIRLAGEFLESRLKEDAVAEELGRCMDDVMLDCIPPTWPLVTQMYLIVKLFDGLYVLAENPEFPDGSQRRVAFLSKLVVFFKSRAGTADAWDLALFRLALSTVDFEIHRFSYHSIHCWHITRSLQCACQDAYIRNLSIDSYRYVLCESTLIQHAKSQLLPDGQHDVSQDSVDVLLFILSLSETSPQATRLSSFIRVMDEWIEILLKHCPQNNDLYNALGRICTAPLPGFSKREEDESWVPAKQLLNQTDAFNEYTKRCREAGIETMFPPIRFPDDWWEDEMTRNLLIEEGNNPPFEIPDRWWEYRTTRPLLLNQEYKPPFDIPNDWWEDVRTRISLLNHEYKPPFDIPSNWWHDHWNRIALLKQGYRPAFDIPKNWWQQKSTRQLLRSRGYPPPDPYSAEETASEPEPDASEDEEPAVSREAGPLAGGEALLRIALPQVLPSSGATSSNPLPIQPVAPAHPMATPAVGAENGQVVPSNVGGRRRRLRDSLKNIFRK